MHTFHIPVLGLAYSIDTPLKVAKYGISSVISIVDDMAIERVRKFHTDAAQIPFHPISETEIDFGAKRITAYLNMVNDLVNNQFEKLKLAPFTAGNDLCKYFELLPNNVDLKKAYLAMLATTNFELKAKLQKHLKSQMRMGDIDVNIMSKVDKVNFDKNNEALADEYNDALAALRGFAQSNLQSSLVLSAGMNPRLYAYLETFADFFPDEHLRFKKKVILKVSDFRSAFIQAKFLAKKGIWIAEFRIESGLNCGGHAFATEGYLLGPILEEFKSKKEEMLSELFQIYQIALSAKNIHLKSVPNIKLSVQGGVGTAEEHQFLLNHYQLDAVGWGSPFLLVPEVTNVDEKTLQDLAAASIDDFYISNSSPLGVPFNNFRKSSAELQRLQRIEKGRPGSPCTKNYLVSNTEFTLKPICLASRQYQNFKIKELQKANLTPVAYQNEYNQVVEKVCLCEGLVSSFYLKNNSFKPKENRAVTICPGPNLAYFNGVYSLNQMVKHIYGKLDLLENVNRSHVFINELKLYVEHFSKDITANILKMSVKKQKSLISFEQQLTNGIEYYRALFPKLIHLKKSFKERTQLELNELELKLSEAKKALNHSLVITYP